MQILRVPIDDEVNRNKTDPKSLPSKSPCGCNASIFLVFVITINTFDIERVCGGEWGPWLQLLAARRYPITRQPRFISNRFPWLVSSNPSRSCLSLKLARFAVFFCYFVVFNYWLIVDRLRINFWPAPVTNKTINLPFPFSWSWIFIGIRFHTFGHFLDGWMDVGQWLMVWFDRESTLCSSQRLIIHRLRSIEGAVRGPEASSIVSRSNQLDWFAVASVAEITDVHCPQTCAQLHEICCIW